MPVLVTIALVIAQASSGHYGLAMARAVPVGGASRTASVTGVPVVSIPIPPIPKKIGAGIHEVENLGPRISAASAAVVDVASGAVLFGKQPYVVRPLASITKLVTALAVVSDHPAWDAHIEVVPSDIPPEGHTVFRSGDRVVFRDLFTAMLVRSDNGAARALIRGHEAGEGWFSSAAARMARGLGTFSLRVAEPTGLAPENRGTAVDVARLLVAAMEEREIADRLRMPQAAITVERPALTTLSIQSTNLLLRGPTHTFRVMGGKTGYLDESGYNLALVVERAGHEVVIVTLGSASHDDRFRDARLLADWVFKNFQWP